MRPSSLFRAAAAVLLTAAAPAPAHAAEAVYGGGSPSGDAIVVKADAQATKLTSIVVSWRADCSDGDWIPGGGVLTPAEPSAVPGFVPGPTDLLMSRNAKGRFAGSQFAGGTNGVAVVDIAGTLKGDTARGTLKATVKQLDPATGNTITSCTSNQRWVASRAPTVYGGVTSQNQPFVIRVDAKHKMAKNVLTTWYADCKPQGYYRVPDTLVGFPIKPSGAFGNPFAYDVPSDGGGKTHYDYAFSGKLKPKAIKGTLQVKITETDAAGTQTDSCDSGRVSWKATTG